MLFKKKKLLLRGKGCFVTMVSNSAMSHSFDIHFDQTDRFLYVQADFGILSYNERIKNIPAFFNIFGNLANLSLGHVRVGA